jgi:hypothetical protein
MSTRLTSRTLSKLAMAALVLGFVLNGESRGQPKNQKLPKADEKKAAEELKKANIQELKGREAQNLKGAYIYLAMANHDYDGHRAKAMQEVQAAIELLDRSILKNGTNNQKVVALQEEIKAARAKFLAQQQGKVHEPQVLSDLQMKAGRELIQKIAPGLAMVKQPAVTGHVQKALEEIEIALEIR